MKMYWPRGFHKRVKQRCHSVVILNHYSLLFKSFCVTAAAHLLLCIKWYNTFLSNPSRKGIFNVILLLLYATVMDKLLFCFSNFLHLWCVFPDKYHHISLQRSIAGMPFQSFDGTIFLFQFCLPLECKLLIVIPSKQFMNRVLWHFINCC